VRTLLQRREFAFLVVGAFNMALGLSLFAVLLYVLGDQMHYLGVLGLTYALSIASAFFMHRRFVFKVKNQVLVDFVRFCIVQLGAVALNAVVLPILVEAFGLPVFPAQVVSLGIVVVLSYLGHLWFSFHRKATPGNPDVTATT
jgi:putative flippase GtrA